MRGLLFVLIWGASSAQALVIGSPVSTAKDMPALTEAVRNAGGDMHCAEILENPGTFVCGASGNEVFLRALTRAAYLIEGTGGKNTKRLVKNSEVSFENSPIEAFDLKGADILRFSNEATVACMADPDFCLTQEERSFIQDFVLPSYHKNSKFVVITFSLKSSYPTAAIVGHEILHAQYFSNPVFRRTVDAFWAGMDAADKEGVREILAAGIYDRSDEMLMINEFQAYVLMPYAEQGSLPEMAHKYRDSLRARLVAAGAAPLEIPLQTAGLERIAAADIQCLAHTGAKLLFNGSANGIDIRWPDGRRGGVLMKRIASETDLRFQLDDGSTLILVPKSDNKAMGYYIRGDLSRSPDFRCLWTEKD